MPNLGSYIPQNCQASIGNHINGGWAAFPVNTPVVESDVEAPVTKSVNGAVQIKVPHGWPNGAAAEVRDTLIFEGINVINKPQLDATQNAFPGNNSTLAAYGRAYSDIEAGTAWTAGQILNDMQTAGIVLSGWGANIRGQVFASPNIGHFEQVFATTPQDPAATNQRQLPSEQLYQFEWVTRAGAGKLSEKVRDRWLAVQVAAMSGVQRDRLNELIRKFTDELVVYHAGTLGRAEKYNAMLATLAGSNLFPQPPAFLNTPPYSCPTY